MSTSNRQLLTLAIVLALVPATRVRAGEAAFAHATQLYQAEKWQSAVTLFDEVARDPQLSKATQQEAQLYAGECLLRIGKYAEARQRYQLVRHRAPSKRLESQALFRLGEVAWLSGESDEAAKLLQTYTETYPQGDSISYATEYLQQIAQRESEQVRFEMLDQAVSLERDERFDRALAAYNKLLELPGATGVVRAETLRRTALLLVRLGQRIDANVLYRQLLNEYPHSKRTTEVMRAIAWNHIQLDQTAQASEQFQTLLLNFPQSPQAAEAAYWLAQQSADNENGKKALELIERVLAQQQMTHQQPELLAKAMCLKCQLVAVQENWAAIETLVEGNKEIVRDGPLRTKLEYWSAEAAFRLREYDIAKQRFELLEVKVLGIDQPWAAMITLRRAQLAARRQRWTEVLKILDRMDREFPDFELDYEIDYLRGRALAGRGEMTAARRFYRQVLDHPRATKSEVVSMAGWMIGETYFHQRDYPRARVAYETVMNGTSFTEWQSRAALQAGKCWELEQRWDEASRVYANALERWPNSFSGQQLESRLRWAQNQTTMDTTTQQR